MLKLLRILCVAFTLNGCVRYVAPPAAGNGRSPAQDAWSRVLAAFVDDDGRIDFASLARDPGDLETYVAYIAQASPQSHPTLFPRRSDQIAYYINSYNALAMYGVIVHGSPEGLHTLVDRVRFFKLTEFNVGGKAASLYDYENDVIRKAGEPRVHFALNCMSVGCPRLPRVPFRAQELDQQLEAAAGEFFNSPKHVQVDPNRRVVRLSEILDFYSEDFIEEDTSSALIRYVNKYRKRKIDTDFRVEFIPYDWTVNKQEVAVGMRHPLAGGPRLLVKGRPQTIDRVA